MDERQLFFINSIILIFVGTLAFRAIDKNKSNQSEEPKDIITNSENNINKDKNVTMPTPTTREISMLIKSSAFDDGQQIPTDYTCDGNNELPPVTITGVPEDVKSLTLIIDDPDAPGGTWTHLLVWNIPPDKTQIEKDDLPKEAVFGTNDFGDKGYGGPCPPSGTHRYFFKVYALNKVLQIPAGSKRSVLENEMSKSTISQASLMGTYSKK